MADAAVALIRHIHHLRRVYSDALGAKKASSDTLPVRKGKAATPC